jgi:hypothetical protein
METTRKGRNEDGCFETMDGNSFSKGMFLSVR